MVDALEGFPVARGTVARLMRKEDPQGRGARPEAPDRCFIVGWQATTACWSRSGHVPPAELEREYYRRAASGEEEALKRLRLR